MTRTLQDDLATDAATLLCTSEFAESVTYYPAGGGPARSIVVLIFGEAARQEATGALRVNTERVQVFLLSDPDHEKGGVATPLRHERGADAFERTSDPAGGRYVFTGRVIESDAASWTLEFERPKLRTVGTEHRAR